jgi:hypothetical protein
MGRAWIAAAGAAGLSLIVVFSAAASTPTAHASGQSPQKVWPVVDAASFAKAVSAAEAGDAIRLADGLYPALAITGRKFSAPVTVTGGRGARLAGLSVSGASNLVVSGVTVTPPGATRAEVKITRSSGITLDGLLVDGRSENAGAWIVTDPSDAEITIRNSELTNCGGGNRCIGPGATGLQILHDTFHDCLDCDFIRGQAGGSTVIADSTFDRAVPGPACTDGTGPCNHNDIIQILGGGPWTIVRNRFGDRSGGAASVFVSTSTNNKTNRIHDVTVASNVFMSEDAGYFAIFIAAGGIPGPPLDVSVVNNTVLSGSAAGVRLGPPWASLPPDQRPLVANNIFGRSKTNGLCAEARTSHNLTEQGAACPGDFVGPAKLDAGGAPTTESTLVRGRADPGYAPATDYYGHPRGASPDIGAIQFGSTAPLEPFALTAPRIVTVSRRWLAKHGWKASVVLRLTGVKTLRARVLLNSRPVLTRTVTVTGRTKRTESFVVPVKARTAPRLKLEFRGTAPDGRTAFRTTSLRIVS